MNEIDGTPENTSLKRLEANRRNCRKSTGPRTTRGKANSRMNAVKHGIYSVPVVVNGMQVRERSKEFQELRNRLWEELEPVGPLEEMLVDRIVTAHWRIQRALTAETGEVALSVDGGHWARVKREPEAFRRLFNGLCDPVVEMERSALGLGYLIRALEELRAEVTRDGELTEEALGHLRRRFCGVENSLTRELAGMRDAVAANPEGSGAEALKAQQQRAVVGRIDGKLNWYQEKIQGCEEREENEEDARQAAEILPSAAVLDKILRYETTVERQLYRAMNQLERVQRRRNGDAVPPPITMDVSGKL